MTLRWFNAYWWGTFIQFCQKKNMHERNVRLRCQTVSVMIFNVFFFNLKLHSRLIFLVFCLKIPRKVNLIRKQNFKGDLTDIFIKMILNFGCPPIKVTNFSWIYLFDCPWIINYLRFFFCFNTFHWSSVGDLGTVWPLFFKIL